MIVGVLPDTKRNSALTHHAGCSTDNDELDVAIGLDDVARLKKPSLIRIND